MSAPSSPSALELQALSVLYYHGPSTVTTVLENLPDGKDRAYTTVLSVMQGLERKNLVRAHREGRAHVYQPIKSQDSILLPITKEFIQNAFEDSIGKAILYMLSTGALSPEEKSAIERELKTHRTMAAKKKTTKRKAAAKRKVARRKPAKKAAKRKVAKKAAKRKVAKKAAKRKVAKKAAKRKVAKKAAKKKATKKKAAKKKATKCKATKKKVAKRKVAKKAAKKKATKKKAAKKKVAKRKPAKKAAKRKTVRRKRK